MDGAEAEDGNQDTPLAPALLAGEGTDTNQELTILRTDPFTVGRS